MNPQALIIPEESLEGSFKGGTSGILVHLRQQIWSWHRPGGQVTKQFIGALTCSLSSSPKSANSGWMVPLCISCS